jgi:hypothetical protein
MSAHLKGWEVIVFRSCSFAAERPIPGLILAICTVSVSQLRSALKRQKAVFTAFESAPWIPSAVVAGLRRNEIAASPTTAYSVQGENKCEKWCNSSALFALFLFLLRFCMLALLCMLSR